MRAYLCGDGWVCVLVWFGIQLEDMIELHNRLQRHIIVMSFHWIVNDLQFWFI